MNMENFELLDGYLSNRLNEQERIAFEKKMEGDPSLKSDVELQKQIVQGIRKARAAQLKGMLNNVPVTGGSTWGAGKIAAGIVAAGVAVTALYFFTSDEPQVVTEETTTQLISASPDEVKTAVDTSGVIESLDEKEPVIAAEEKVILKTTKVPGKTASPVRKPDIKPADPTEEFSQENTQEEGTPGRSEISASKMEVITELADKKHNFHYQFSQGKLFLYGPFDKSLYEIIEIHGDGHAVFLKYRENYYLLDEKESNITPLVLIKDSQLLKKLKEYQNP